MDEAGSVEHIVAVAPINKAERIPCGKINKTKDIPVVKRWIRTADSVLRLYRDNLSQEEVAEAGRSRIDVYDILTANTSKASLGSDGLVLIPDFVGDTTGGAFIGLSLRHGKNEMIRAILESVAYEIRACFEELKRLSLTSREIRVVGGGAKSSFWLQLKADVTGKMVSRPAYIMPGTRGAIILSGIGIGEYKDAFEGVRRIYKDSATYTPDVERIEFYNRSYEVYKDLKSGLYSTILHSEKNKK